MAHDLPSDPSQTLGVKLTEHRVLIFDVYGTLIDWESAIHDAFAAVFPDLTREEILFNYARTEGNLQMQFPNTNYSKLLGLTYRQLVTPDMATADIAEGDAHRFGSSIPEWKPFPDTVDALHRLKKHFALVVLSNVDDSSFVWTHKNLCTPAYPGSAYSTVTPESSFSLILTAQQIGAYKPNPSMLESALKQLSANPNPSLPYEPSVRADASQVLIVANSIRHDIIPAAEHGLRSIWISRRGANSIGNESNVAVSLQEGATTGGRYLYTWRYETLSRMADAVEGEARVY